MFIIKKTVYKSLHKKSVYKEPRTRHPKIQESFETTMKKQRNLQKTAHRDRYMVQLKAEATTMWTRQCFKLVFILS